MASKAVQLISCVLQKMRGFCIAASKAFKSLVPASLRRRPLFFCCVVASVFVLGSLWLAAGPSLLWAVANKHVKTVQALLLVGVSPNVQDEFERTALILAVQQNQPDVVKLLLDKGANPNIQDKWKRTALMLAAPKQYEMAKHLMVKHLLDAGAQPHIQDNNGETALSRLLFDVYGLRSSELMYERDNEVVYATIRSLLADGSPAGLQNKVGSTILHRLLPVSTRNSIRGSNVQLRKELIEFLLKHGANPNVKDDDGTTALMEAVSEEDCWGIKKLLAAGADPNLQDEDGRTAIMRVVGDWRSAINPFRRYEPAQQRSFSQNRRAVDELKCDAVKLLLAAKADLNLQDEDGNSALMLGIQSCYTTNCYKMLKTFLEAGADSKTKNLSGQTLLHRAIKRPVGLKAVNILLNSGVDPNVQDRQGQTALHIALHVLANFRTYNPKSWAAERVRFLLETGADPNIQDHQGRTALHIIVESSTDKREAEDTALVQFLLKAGAQPNIQDEKGRTALQWAKFGGHTRLVQLLKSTGTQEVH